MQIDWLSAIVSTPPELWPGYESGRTLKIGPFGEVLENRITASLVEEEEASSSRNFRVLTPSPGSLYLSGNPVKLLQRHNLFGSLDLLGLYLEAGTWVRQHAGLFPGPQTWQSCQFSMPRYTRIDLTRSYRFSSDSEALDYIRHVVGTAKTRHGQAKLYGSGTAYFGQNSTRWTMKVYAKRQEMDYGLKKAARKLAKLAPAILSDMFSDELMDWANGIVRFELTLRGPEIQKYCPPMDINDPVNLRNLWQHYYDSIQFNENAAMSHKPDLIEETLPRYLLGTVAMWRTGLDLRKHLPTNTFYRHRREIIHLCAIDISVPPVNDIPTEVQATKSILAESGWDPEPIQSRLVEPRQDLKQQYSLTLS